MPNFTALRQQTSHFFKAGRLGQAIALATLLAPTTTWASHPLAGTKVLAGATTSVPPMPGKLSGNRTRHVAARPAVLPAGAAAGGAPVTAVAAGRSAHALNERGGADYYMANRTITDCSGTLSDSGYLVSYANNENYTMVVAPGTTGAKLRLSFLSFSTEASNDILRIYDGPSTSYPLVGTYSGSNSPGTVTATSSNPTGRLTLAFTSNATVTAAGFEAAISCVSGTTTAATFSTTSRNPAANAVGVAASTPVGVTFSDVPTAASAATIRVFAGQAGGRRTLGAATVSGTTATLPLAGNAFKPGETVLVTVPATVTSTTGATAEPYAYQFTTATTASSGRIGAKLADYTTGTQPSDLGLGDITGDGVPDLVVSSATDNTIAVLAGQGNGTFGARVSYAAGVAPYIIVLGDVNGDGRLDVLTTSQTGAAATVLLGTAGGGLGGPTSYATLSNSSGAVLADFNRDGWLDIAATDGGTSTVPGTSVSVFLNNGNGTFGARASYATGSRPIAVSAGDLNGDGRPDLVTSNQATSTVSVLLGTGTGGFGARTDYAVGTGPFIMTLGDLDNDTDLDVVTCNQLANTVTVLRGTGNGALTGRVDYATGSSPQDVDLGDMNGDGRLDIVTADYTNNTVSILLNSTAGFTRTSYASASGPVSTVLGDVNGDGRLDLAALNTTSTTISVFLGLPLPTITSFLPGSGPVGTSVTITGTFLTGATQLLLNGVAVSSFTVNAAGTALTFTVPAGATSGLLSVTTPAGTATSSAAFTVTVPQLAVTQGGTAYPSSGAPYAFGSQVLNTTSAAASFTLANAGTAPLTLTSITTTGNFALSGPAPTTVAAGGSATVGVTFTPTAIGSQMGTLRLVSSLGTYVVNLTGTGIYPVPTSTSLTPGSGPVGTVVTITGSGFLTNGTTVTLNGLPIAGAVVSNGGTTLTFTVPAGATAGPVVVTTAGGTVTAGAFCVQYAPTATGASRCGAGSLTLTATGAPAGGTYAWYTQATGGSPIAGATGASYSPTLTATTTFYVAIGTGAGATACEGTRQAATATINPLPVVIITASGSPNLCAGGSVTLTASGADSYKWSTGQSTASITVSTAGSYSVAGLSAAGCMATSAATTVTVTPLPGAPAVTPASTCGPGPVALAATGAPAGGSYAWYLAATGGPAIAGATGASYTTPSLGTTTTYYVSALTAAGCEGPRAAVVATVNAVPVVTVAASGALSFCQGGSVVLTASGGGAYQWSTGATTASITVSTSGSYSVLATNASGCAATSPSTTITVSPLPAQPTITQAPTGVLSSSSPTGNQWYRNGVAVPGATGASYVIATAAQLGSYTVVITSAAGCTSPASAALNIVVTGTNTPAQATAMQLYPNPAQTACTLDAPAIAGVGSGQLTLVNSLGQVVLTRTLALAATGTRAQLDLHGLAAGVYLVRLQAGTTLLTKHLVVE